MCPIGLMTTKCRLRPCEAIPYRETLCHIFIFFLKPHEEESWTNQFRRRINNSNAWQQSCPLNSVSLNHLDEYCPIVSSINKLSPLTDCAIDKKVYKILTQREFQIAHELFPQPIEVCRLMQNSTPLVAVVVDNQLLNQLLPLLRV